MCNANQDVDTRGVGTDADGGRRAPAPEAPGSFARKRAYGPPPIIPPDPDGVPWVRLITGLVVMAILAMPIGRHAVQWTTTPVARRPIAPGPLRPLEPPGLQSPIPQDRAPSEGGAPDANPERPKPPARWALLRVRAPNTLHAKAASPRLPHSVLSRRHGNAFVRLAPATRSPTRAQVVRDYLAARDQVAAFTGEDSGSAWLMRRRLDAFPLGGGRMQRTSTGGGAG
jgi:hypothetical protein